MRVRNRIAATFALAVFALALVASPALALPSLEVDLSNEPTVIPRTDEGEYYTATVTNSAPENPGVGDELTCLGTPADNKHWFGRPAPTFTYQWLRSGEAIPGATERTYTITEADKSQSLQCAVTGTNQSTTSGTATTEAGSNVITDVTTATGSGTLTAGSTVITGVTTASGRFATGQTIVGAGIQPGTTVGVAEALPDPHTELFLSAPATASGLQTFSAGPGGLGVHAAISGPGIPPETTVIAVNGRTLTLSANATASASGVAISGTFAPTASSVVSLPPVVVAPAPVPPPLTGRGRPQLVLDFTNPGGVGAEGAKPECRAPDGAEAWSGDSINWSFQWLLNGVPAPHAPLETTSTSSKYELQTADVEPSAVLRCEVIGRDAGGNEAVASGDTIMSTGSVKPPAPYAYPTGTAPTVSDPNTTFGPVRLEVELPAGAETFAFKAAGAGWDCSRLAPAGETHARVVCSREDPLAPGASYPAVSISAQLGEDAPQIGTAVATASGGNAPSSASDEASYEFGPGFPFGALAGSFRAKVSDEGGDDYTLAGGHPFQGFSTFGFNVHRSVAKGYVPSENIKDVVVDLPRGLVGNALATPELCKSIEDVILTLCPPRSAVGGINVYIQPELQVPTNESIYPNQLASAVANLPIYSLEPEFGEPAQFAFAINLVSVPYTFVPELRADEGYAIDFRTAPIVTYPPLYGTDVTVCDFGARLEGVGKTAKFERCRGATEAGAYPEPLFTNPTRCSGPPPSTGLRLDSWQHPADVKTYDFTGPAMTECEAVRFEPKAQLKPTDHEAESPTGLTVEITMPTEGLLSPTGFSQANLDNAKVTFPKGMVLNPAAAAGLSACSLAQVRLHSNAEAQCPESSKVGTVEIDTPLIRKTLTGSVYLARQGENPFNSTVGIYLVFSSKRDGVTIKVAGKLVPDPQTGQLVSTFAENPEAPFSRIAMHFNQGPRAPLINPPTCGTYAITAEFSPWSAVNPANPTAGEIVTDKSTYRVTRGPNGGPCPRGTLEPMFSAGLEDARAGAKSPFVLQLSRKDGTERFTGLSVTNPKGLTAYLRGVGICPNSSLAAVSGEEGAAAAELAHPSCPAASQVGTVSAGAGAGPSPFYVKTGKVYLAGPYKGAPISLAILTPALAGPFDLGTVLVRTPLYIDPETAQVRAVSDPIPTALHGITLDLRDVRVALDRPGFTAAPTNCEPASVSATVSGEAGGSATVSRPFNVGGCDHLAFKPRLSFRLFGGTHRSAHPKLRAILRAPLGGANIASAQVALPHTEFLDQSHIRTVCTRVQFAAHACPAASIYGHATATTPLLDSPLKGPVYLRSSNHELPDLVVALRGPDSQPIEVVLDGRVDSIHGGVRSTFEAVPDQPVSSFVLTMKGGRKGLLQNSTNICRARPRVTVRLVGQNGRSRRARLPLRSACKKSAARRGHSHSKRHI